MRKWGTTLAVFLVAASAQAQEQMTPEEQTLATALTGAEGALNSGASNMSYLRGAIFALTHRKDQEIQSLKTMIGSEDKRIKELTDQVTVKEEAIKGLEAKLKIVVQNPENQQVAPAKPGDP